MSDSAGKSTICGPPPGWNADEAAERIRQRAHAYPEHKRWLEDPNHECAYCEANNG